MSKFYLVNEKRYPLPAGMTVSSIKGVNQDLLPYYRWEHRATVGYNGKRYIVFLDNLENKAYIEDCTNGLKQIQDESLAKAIGEFATNKGYLVIMPPLMKDGKTRFV